MRWITVRIGAIVGGVTRCGFVEARTQIATHLAELLCLRSVTAAASLKLCIYRQVISGIIGVCSITAAASLKLAIERVLSETLEQCPQRDGCGLVEGTPNCHYVAWASASVHSVIAVAELKR